MMMQQIETLAHSLAYYQRKQNRSGWQDLMQTVFSGIAAFAAEEEGRDFLRLLGTQFAQQHPLPPAETIFDLEVSINSMLARFDWGELNIEASEQALTLIHYAYPIAPDAEQQTLWLSSFSTILTGMYAEWLLQQGGAPHVSLFCSHDEPDDQLVFCYHNETKK
jgi:hypothetical protein